MGLKGNSQKVNKKTLKRISAYCFAYCNALDKNRVLLMKLSEKLFGQTVLTLNVLQQTTRVFVRALDFFVLSKHNALESLC